MRFGTRDHLNQQCLRSLTQPSYPILPSASDSARGPHLLVARIRGRRIIIVLLLPRAEQRLLPTRRAQHDAAAINVSLNARVWMAMPGRSSMHPSPRSSIYPLHSFVPVFTSHPKCAHHTQTRPPRQSGTDGGDGTQYNAGDLGRSFSFQMNMHRSINRRATLCRAFQRIPCVCQLTHRQQVRALHASGRRENLVVGGLVVAGTALALQYGIKVRQSPVLIRCRRSDDRLCLSS